jgi:hypothetical protein
MNEPAPDFLQFEGGGAITNLEANVELLAGALLVEADKLRVMWKGPWPPPDKMAIAVGRETGIPKVFEPAKLGEGLTLADVQDVAHVTLYDRVSASELPDDHRSPHLARGAIYLPELAS